MFKKIISMILTVALIAGNCSAIFAQSVGKIKYKPAKSFTYDFFELGKTEEKTFIYRLKKDMDENTDEDSFEPIDMQNNIIKDADPLNNRFMQYKPVAKAYNNFMYYNAYPKQSPYWKWTALVSDDEASENDVLLILLKHKQISEEILKLFKENPRYKRERADRITLVTMGTLILALESWALWEVAAALPVSKWISTPVLLGLDILGSDYIAYNLRNLEEAKRYLNDVDIQLATFDNIKNRNMLKSQIESNKISICNKAKETAADLEKAYIATNGRLSYETKNEMAKWEKIASFCNNDQSVLGDKSVRLEIGQYLQQEYNKLPHSKQRVEYIRKEMLHIYYALLFIREELKDKSDRLRFDRALIDMATTYKIAYVTFTDGRIASWNKPPEFVSQMDILQENGLDETDFVTTNEEGEEVYTDLGGELMSKIMPNRSYPSLLNRAQLNYIVQKIDIQRQKKDFAAAQKMENFWDEQSKINRWEAFK